MEQGENGATGSAAGRQMARGGGTSTWLQRIWDRLWTARMSRSGKAFTEQLGMPQPNWACKSYCRQGWGGPKAIPCAALAEG